LSQIFNKSLHPVAIKRIPVRIWALRDEIESALEHRIKECEAAGTPLYIDDIKEFYGMKKNKPLTGQPQLIDVNAEAPQDTPSENVDDMMEALADQAPEAETAPSEVADQLIASQTPEEQKQSPAEHLQKPFVRRAPNSDKLSYGFSFLSDLNMDWALCFSKYAFTQGSSIVIEFLIPSPFIMSAEVMLCTQYSMRSRIISETKPDYRIQSRFTFSMDGERGQLRDFLKSVEPTLPQKVSLLDSDSEDSGPEA
jgi:hypothetical protein